jgi:hypothetical protein
MSPDNQAFVKIVSLQNIQLFCDSEAFLHDRIHPSSIHPNIQLFLQDFIWGNPSIFLDMQWINVPQLRTFLASQTLQMTSFQPGHPHPSITVRITLGCNPRNLHNEDSLTLCST